MLLYMHCHHQDHTTRSKFAANRDSMVSGFASGKAGRSGTAWSPVELSPNGGGPANLGGVPSNVSGSICNDELFSTVPGIVDVNLRIEFWLFSAAGIPTALG